MELIVCHDEIHLVERLVKNDSADDGDSDHKPGDDWSMGVKIFFTKRLLSSVHIYICLIIGDIIGDKISISLHVTY